MSIGWVIFWKAVVLAVLALGAEKWAHMKREDVERGLPMREDVDGVYRPHSRFLLIEKWARRVFWTLAIPLGLYTVLVVYVLVAHY